jgi:hypothetical protein
MKGNRTFFCPVAVCAASSAFWPGFKIAKPKAAFCLLFVRLCFKSDPFEPLQVLSDGWTLMYFSLLEVVTV